jgi:hypothetical protein
MNTFSVLHHAVAENLVSAAEYRSAAERAGFSQEFLDAYECMHLGGIVADMVSAPPDKQLGAQYWESF